MNIFMTGASGFIGSCFLQYGPTRGYQIRGLTRNSNHMAFLDGIEWFQGDLIDELDWQSALLNIDVVVHAAAEICDENLMQKVNVDASHRLLKAAIAAGVRRWVQLSSVGAYGLVHDGLVTEDWSESPIGSYEVSKTDFDKMLQQAAQSSSMEVCILRPSNVYGSGMRNQSIVHMLNAIRKNLFAFIGPKGASANYVHVQDVVQALDLCISHPKAANQVYIVSAWASMEEMVGSLSEGAALNVPSRRTPLSVATLIAKMMQWWPRWPLTLSRVQAMSLRNRYSTEKIEKELGWKLTVPVKEGMRDFARDCRQ